MAAIIATRRLALRPRNGLDLNAASGAIRPAHGVGERDGNVPDRDEFELPRPQHSIISGSWLGATRASGFAVGPGNDYGNDPHRIARAAQSDGVVNEALEGVDFVA